ncbi:deacetylase [Sorangium cellulosum]|uniref:Deacetylase n=1 Tax=Sorangium cellulosum TaxID=56 RepID=A0A2L0FBR4_SORCE|nr:histone deacetylase [Sorangium cellulosum]AUX49048.1 deacetylase [Sorangium cellulosum]
MTAAAAAAPPPMRVFHSPRYFADIGQHVMPMRKFALVREAIERSGLPARIEAPEPVSDEDLLRVHTPEYLRAIATGEPRALAESQKFPWSPELAGAVRFTNGGCIAATFAALEDGIAGNLASGFHHAHAAHGEGFCTFNGLVVALERARAEGRIRRGLVVDMDLHYGNGTASLLASRPWAFGLSIYGNWYKQNKAYRDVDGERAPDTENSWSVPVPNGSGGGVYLDLLARHLGPAIHRAEPDVILYQAGADPYREDPYSPLDLTHDDLRARDELVFRTAQERGIPIAWVLAGGYTPDVSRVVEVHLNTFVAAVRAREAQALRG